MTMVKNSKNHKKLLIVTHKMVTDQKFLFTFFCASTLYVCILCIDNLLSYTIYFYLIIFNKQYAIISNHCMKRRDVDYV